MPINLGVSQVFKIGEQAMSFQVGGKYYAEAPEGGPEWGIRTTLTFLFPKSDRCSQGQISISEQTLCFEFLSSAPGATTMSKVVAGNVCYRATAKSAQRPTW
ncbi:hypothetical protein [Mesorhizobium sp. YR577]|uniref:hypothetical protein n=1 Tax=Mesorhizobium sp. YR577 TaxID=1884373 RepID=UPI0008ED375A|nr:hypothetical protein [Mesorhizobium sp. YR577]SFU22456.1 hypothetical protein SAMN05518861_1362 [Mesorhizobium sp. YR577]